VIERLIRINWIVVIVWHESILEPIADLHGLCSVVLLCLLAAVSNVTWLVWILLGHNLQSNINVLDNTNLSDSIVRINLNLITIWVELKGQVKRIIS